MKKAFLLLLVTATFAACRTEMPEQPHHGSFTEAIEPTIEHISIPLTNEQLHLLFHSMTPVGPQTRGSVSSIETKEQLIELACNNSGLLTVFFWAPWCGPCRAFAPTFEKVADELSPKKCLFAKVNVDNAEDLAYECEIRSIPTIIIIKNLEIRERIVGLISEEKFRQYIGQYIDPYTL